MDVSECGEDAEPAVHSFLPHMDSDSGEQRRGCEGDGDGGAVEADVTILQQ